MKSKPIKLREDNTGGNLGKPELGDEHVLLEAQITEQ